MNSIKTLPASGPEGLEEMRLVLAESAPLTLQWAQEGCWHDPSKSMNCAWYHGAWQTLRLLGIVATLTQQAELYISALRPLIASGNFKRVFLSGSADYGLLSVILDAFNQEGVVPSITVVDRCATPLRLCRWYAERYGYSIETVQSDLAAFRSDAPYDLICVHSLLSCVPRANHADIVATWHNLLRPGGTLMMANNVYPGLTGKKTGFSAEQISAYRERVMRAARECPFKDALPPDDEIEKIATTYATHMEGTVISSRSQLTDILEAQGFALEDTRFGDLFKNPDHQRSGAPVDNKKEYAWIVARRV